MIPEHVLRKMRAAVLVAGAAGCTRAGTSQDAGARDEGGARSDDATVRTADAATDDASALPDEAGVSDAGDDAADGAVIACPFHPEGHVILGDGGVQQARIDPGIQHIGLGELGNLNNRQRDPCPGCGMGGPRDWDTPGRPLPPAGEVQIGDASGVSEAQTGPLRRLLAGQRAGIRACYRAGLNTNPTQQGRLVAVITWGPGGEVRTVTTSETAGLEAPVVNCVARRIRNAGPITELSGATATVRMTFITQK